jgi:hypothetical protein
MGTGTEADFFRARLRIRQPFREREVVFAEVLVKRQVNSAAAAQLHPRSVGYDRR